MGYIVRPDTLPNIIASLDQRVFTLETKRVNNPCARLWGGGNQIVTNGTDTKVSLANVSYIQGGMTQSSSTITVPVTGFYSVVGTWVCQGGSAGNAVARLYISGVVYSQNQLAISSTVQIQPIVHDILSLTAGNTVSLYANQSSGGTITTYNAGSNSTYYYLSVALISS